MNIFFLLSNLHVKQIRILLLFFDSDHNGHILIIHICNIFRNSAHFRDQLATSL